MAVFNKAKHELILGNIDFGVDSFKVALLTNAYTPNIDTQEFWSDVSANEASGTNYTAGGGATTITVTRIDASDLTEVDGTTVTFANSTVTARYAILYKDTGTPTTSVLISYTDFGSDQSSVGADFNVTVNANGLLRLS